MARGRKCKNDWVGNADDGWYALTTAIVEQAHRDAARDCARTKRSWHRQQVEQAQQTAVDFLDFLSELAERYACQS